MRKVNRIRLIYTICLLSLASCSFAQQITRNLDSLDWKFRRVGDSVWYKATVPGTVHTDLFNNHLIPDPFYGDNEKRLQWIDTLDWEYEAEFNISEEELKQAHIEIDFKGLDTYAKVYVNDSLVIDAFNMFLEWDKDIKSHIHSGKNKLRVRFSSALKHDIAEEKKLPYKLPGEERLFSRKAQYQYGWDFAPKFISCGILGNVSLMLLNKSFGTGISRVSYHVDDLSDSLAKVILHYEIYNADSIAAIHSLLIIYAETHVRFDSVLLKPGFNEIDRLIEIHSPRMWWCNGLGEPYLYLVKTFLYNKYLDKTDSNKIDMGVRTIELVQDSDRIGKSFYFKLNGVPAFMKGANYVPQDMFLPRVNKAKADSIVDMAAAANMNMLRVWGGGVYADDEFYKECDKKGILVWQDFMFACGIYPFDSSLYDYQPEIDMTVFRLQNHPCFALWCGNNEIKEGWYNWDWQKEYKYSSKDSAEIWNEYVENFEDIIPNLIFQCTSREKFNYIPTSPQIGWGHKESLLYGDSHYWGVWWGMEPFEIYNEKVGRFMSEYGFQSLPDIETLNKITDTLSLSSLKLKNHQKHPTGFQTINEYMQRDYKVPTKFEDYVYVSQLLQAEGMTTAIEAHRRHKPTCMGTLYWQFNDCWPGITWSSIDYYGRPKALYYRVKELYDNILISITKKGENYNVYIVSDSLKPLTGVLEMKLKTFEGEVLQSKSVKVNIPANGPAIYAATVDKDFLDKIDTTKTVLECRFMGRRKLFYFAKPKNLTLPFANLTVYWKNNTTLVIKTDKLAKNVYLQMDGVTFSDNYFDLLPGETKTIKCNGEKESALTIISLGVVMRRN